MRKCQNQLWKNLKKNLNSMNCNLEVRNEFGLNDHKKGQGDSKMAQCSKRKMMERVRLFQICLVCNFNSHEF